MPAFYEDYGPGAVVSATIDKYIYVMLHPRFDELIRFTSFKEEVVDNVEKMEQGIVREALLQYNVQNGIDVIAVSDVPPGTGMGSSGTFTVGLLHALRSYCQKTGLLSRQELAEDACKLEIERLRQPVGKQDQYAASFGGFSIFEFSKKGMVKRTPIFLKDKIIKKLERHSLLFFLDIQRSASKVLKAQVDNMSQGFKLMNEMKARVPDTVAALKTGDLECLGSILQETWEIKKKLASSISSPVINDYYEKAILAGAYGGKVLGAGGGGFLYLLAAEEKHDLIRAAIDLKELPFHFESKGTILLHDNSLNKGGDEEIRNRIHRKIDGGTEIIRTLSGQIRS